MPQLDKVTFLSQIFWLIVFFSILFWYVNNYLVPTIARNLKYRKILLSKFQNEISDLEIKKTNLLVNFDKNFVFFSKKIKENFKKESNEQELLLNNKLFLENLSKVFPAINLFNNYKFNHNIYLLRKGCI